MLPVGTAYAVWTGIGAVGTALLGILILGESANPVRIVSIILIVGGIAGLKLAGQGSKAPNRPNRACRSPGNLVHWAEDRGWGIF